MPAEDAQDVVAWVHRTLEEDRGIVIEASPLEVADAEVDGIKWPKVFYKSGLAINVL